MRTCENHLTKRKHAVDGSILAQRRNKGSPGKSRGIRTVLLLFFPEHSLLLPLFFREVRLNLRGDMDCYTPKQTRMIQPTQKVLLQDTSHGEFSFPDVSLRDWSWS